MFERSWGPIFLLVLISSAANAASLRFYGNGSGDVDRIKIPIDAPARPANVAGDFTLEWWMKALPGENATAACAPGPIGIDTWMTGNVIFDRDVEGVADYGEYGVSILGGHVAFGVAVGTAGETLCGSTDVADGAWHHVAVMRRAADGQIAIFVDGNTDGTMTTEAIGDIGYRSGRASLFPDSDPYLVIGARKTGSGPAFHGWIDEIRISQDDRYPYNLPYARQRVTFASDANTVFLAHLEEFSGNTIHDESGAFGGPSNGVRKIGGSPAGPEWSTESAPLQVATGFGIVGGWTLGPDEERATAITHAGDGSGRMFATETYGRIRIAYETPPGAVGATPFLDLRSKVVCCEQFFPGNRGLRGLAFHPAYTTNGYFYVLYTRVGDGAIVIARYHVSADPDLADASSETILKVIPHPTATRNGGGLAFGRDGYLYAGIGDGGSLSGIGPAQDLNTLLGKILRLDVDGTAPYIPPDNPFVSGGGLPEIWAFGLANPTKIAFDRLTGDLFITDAADAVTGNIDEVDLQRAGEGGGQNYGWPVLMADSCYHDVPYGSCAAFLNGGSTLPILKVNHGRWGCASVGGHLFRGLPKSSAEGNFLHADQCLPEYGTAVVVRRGIQDANGGWTSEVAYTFKYGSGPVLDTIGEDEKKHVVIADSEWGDGRLHRLSPITFSDIGNPPAWSAVEAITAAGITAGCRESTWRFYCPDANITRAQMAIFLLRAKYGQSYLPPAQAASVFADVPAGSFEAAWIERLLVEGITGGCSANPPLYCPNQPIRRDSMSVLLLRAREGEAYVPPACTGIFVDAPCSNYFAPWIEELDRRVGGLTTACAEPPCLIEPARNVTRGEMAIYVTRVFNLPLP